MAFSAKRTVERTNSAWRYSEGVAAAAIYLVLRSSSGRSWNHLIATTPTAVQIAAVGLVGIGLAFCAWARVTLGGNWSGAVVFKENHELIQSGPYALVRHPIYTGMLVMVLGTVVDYPAVLSYVLFVAVVVVFFFKSRSEERLMIEHFPDQYPAYRARVKALIPFVL
jgi:protein-S-isoprenylcysteine O-methyltransferase Ste14